MRCSHRRFSRLVFGAVALGFVVLLGTAKLSASPLPVAVSGLTRGLSIVGQDPLGRPLYQSAVSFDKLGAVVPSEQFSLTDQFLLQLAPHADLATFAQNQNLVLQSVEDLLPGHFLATAPSPLATLKSAEQALGAGIALLVEPQFAHQQRKRDTPNDSLFGNQWHLRNTGQSGGTAGADINVAPWWDFAGNTRLGSGVNIAIVDDGLQSTHPDLALNYRSGLSRDINFNDADPTPDAANEDFHGTSVAGVAAARGHNGIGVSGVAPRAGLAGIRLIAAGTTDAQEAQGLTFQNNNQAGLGTNHIFSNSWGPSDTGGIVEGPGPLTAAAIANAVATGRGGRGTIFTWAAGNGGSADNSNYDGYANSRYVIAVGASRNNANGAFASYSEPGANMLVNAPSNGGSLAITTTDLTGAVGYSTTDYANDFGGTSSATPVVSGVVALMLEANPNLGWRDVKHILVRTAAKNDPTHSGWTNNAAGRAINHNFGFGRVNATAAATLAMTWTNVGPEVVASAASATNLNLAILDGTGTSAAPVYGPAVTNTLAINSPIKIETVEVAVNLTHTYRGDLQILLTAPSGTQSILGAPRNDSTDNLNWVFTTVRNWDEMATGNWTLSIRDGVGVDVGRFNSWSLRVYGTVAIPEPATWLLASLGALAFGRSTRRKVLAGNSH